MNMYKNHFNASEPNSSTFSDHTSEKFSKYTLRTEDCPICASHDGRCKTTGNGLTLCMSFGKDDVPESILNRWSYRGLNKTQEWHLWADKEHPSFNNSGKGFDAKSTSKKKGSQATKKVLTLHPNVLDSIYRGITKEVGLSDRAKQDLIKRGIDPDKYLGFSVDNQVISRAIKAYGMDAARLFPGADSLGILRYAGEGYTCPAFNKYGQVIGYQVRYFDHQPKYTWAATNNKIEINGDLELPINLVIGDPESKILYLSEGLLKPLIASNKLVKNVLGAAGGNLCASYNQLLENIEGYEQIIWAVDAGAIANERVMRQYLRASKAIETATGIKVQYLWYGQVDKATGLDIDELDADVFDFTSIISKEELLEIAGYQGLDTSLLFLETESKDNQETPNNPDETKLVVTNDWELTKELKSKGQSVVYVQSFYSANVITPLWELDDLAKYSKVEVITKEGDKYAPWLDPTGKQPKYLRCLDGDLEKLLGIAPVGDTRNEQDFKKYLGAIETDDPYFAYPDKLCVRAKNNVGLIYRDMGEGWKAPKITLRTERGSIPLGAVAYFGSYLSLPNADRDTEGKYLPEIDINTVPFGQGNVIAVKSPMGSGKNVASNRFIKFVEALFGRKIEVQVTSFSPTKYLNRISASNIDGMESLNDFKEIGLAQSEKETIARIPRLSLCLNSAGDLEKRDYGSSSTISIVLLDELESMLGNLNDPDSHYDKSKLTIIKKELFRAIRETTENDGYVLVMDADLQDITVISLCEAAGVDPSKIVRINHKRTDPGFKYTYCDDISKIRGKIDEMLEEGKKVAVFCDSKRELEQLEQKYLDKGLERIFVMHGENAAHPEYRFFSCNPDAWFEENTPNLFGYNSVIGAGVSIHYNKFDAIFIIPKGILSPNDIRQGSIRFRDLSIPRYIFAKKSRNCDPPSIEYKPSEIRNEIQEGITETLASVGIQSTPEINRLLSQRNPLLNLRALKLARDKYQQYGYWKAIEGGLLIAQNCTPFDVAWTRDASHREVEKILVERDSRLVDEAEILIKDSSAFKQLDALAYKTDKQRAQWLKSIIADTLPGVDINQNFAKEYVVTTQGRNQLKKIKVLGDTVFPDLSLAIAKSFIKKRVEDMLNGTKDNLLFSEINKKTRKVAALNRLGVPSVVEQIILIAVEGATIDHESKKACLPEKVELSLDNEAVENLLDKFIKDLTPNCKALGLKINRYLNRAEKLKRILRLVGFKARDGKNNDVVINLPSNLLDILVAHRKALTTRYDQLVADGKIPSQSGRQESNESPTESLLVKVSSLQQNDIELLKIEVKKLFGLRKLVGEAKNNVTVVIAGSPPPKLLPG
jgi:hypothetical protein